MGWVKDALHSGKLQIMEGMLCPKCREKGIDTLNACQKHKWASRGWFEGMFDSNGNVRKLRKK